MAPRRRGLLGQQYAILLTVSSLCYVLSAFPPTLRHPSLPQATNKITTVNVSCDAANFNVSLSTEQPFKGLLFAKDFSHECRSIGTLHVMASLSLPSSGCGVRLISDPEDNTELYYMVTLVLQQDRFLRQVTDQERVVKCQLSQDSMILHSASMKDILKNEIINYKKRERRTGRMKNGFTKELNEEEASEVDKELGEALEAARAWMEITPADFQDPPNSLQVGEMALLTVKSTLPVGIGWRVVDCMAHDGLGDSSQKLLDERGCPLDEQLLPAMRAGPQRPIALMRHQEAVSKFSAFKFPDRDRLHLSCGLQLCRGSCAKVSCEDDDSTERSSRGLLTKGQEGEILDRLEVFNSVEVIAPGIELEDRNNDRSLITDQSRISSTTFPGDRTFCVSSDKMALAFCVLGLVFLLAVIVAVWALLRARRTVPYYTRSLFSTSSDSSAYGSKLLLHESPCLGQPPGPASSSRSFPYGRVF